MLLAVPRFEIFVPAAKRKWGYYVYPLLEGDRMIGRMEITADRKAGRFFVDAVHQDVPFTAAMTDAPVLCSAGTRPKTIAVAAVTAAAYARP